MIVWKKQMVKVKAPDGRALFHAFFSSGTGGVSDSEIAR